MNRFLIVLALLWLAPLAHANDLVVTQIHYAGDDGGPVPSASQFRNPVLAGFYPDPSAIRVGDDFYLVNSSFGYFPGLPVFHSRDLVNWTQIGNAIDRPSQINYGRNELTRGLFAATMSHHDGTFYILNTCFYCDGGNFVITATHPAGPWSDPIWLDFTGIDPSLFFDRDGRAWVVNNDVPDGALRYDGHRAIWMQQFDVATRRMVGPRRVLVDGGADPSSHPEHIEGPHVFHRNGWYYLTAAEGGTGEQHAQMIWRSREVTGPYLPWAGNPVLTQRDLDPTRADPITSTGHAQFVELKDGTWWAVFLATRPYRGNQYALGRETFLLPVRWHDDWPVILPRGQAVPRVVQRPNLPRDTAATPTTGALEWTERFQAATLPLGWMRINTSDTLWYRTGPQGLRITPAATALGRVGEQPAYLAHRLQHHRATITATLERRPLQPGEQAGLAILQNETHYYALSLIEDTNGPAVAVYRRQGSTDPAGGTLLHRAPLPAGPEPVSLRLALDGPTLAVSYAAGNGPWQVLQSGLDASMLSVEIAGGFTGATFGPYAWRPGP